LELMRSEFQAERKRYEDEAFKHEQQLLEVALCLKETKKQKSCSITKLHSLLLSLFNEKELNRRIILNRQLKKLKLERLHRKIIQRLINFVLQLVNLVKLLL
jgi:hypothetical protein